MILVVHNILVILNVTALFLKVVFTCDQLSIPIKNVFVNLYVCDCSVLTSKNTIKSRYQHKYIVNPKQPINTSFQRRWFNKISSGHENKVYLNQIINSTIVNMAHDSVYWFNDEIQTENSKMKFKQNILKTSTFSKPGTNFNLNFSSQSWLYTYIYFYLKK